MEENKKIVEENITDQEALKKYQKEIESGKYQPELLFNDEKILKRIEKHPMALWKTREKNWLCRNDC